MSFETACVVGAGRAGQAIAARLGERLPTHVTGRDLDTAGADLVVLCVPDAAIAGVARRVPVGPWVCHVSGATTLDALAPHERRFSLHPLMTFQQGLGGRQLDGAFGALTGETAQALAAGFRLADLLGLRPFELADRDRPLYHAAATTAASFLVTLHDAAAAMAEAAGAPAEALHPLMRRVMDNGFVPTGPHVRGDLDTVTLHLSVIGERLPSLLALYRALSHAALQQVER
jgi:predicted short-subunit dehydrogenase-like oxidoreductase (DUF2520 family)